MPEEKKGFNYAEPDKFVKLMAEDDFHVKIASVKGPAFMDYRRQWDMAGRMELETAVPLHLDFELTTLCNFRCPMCPFGMPKGERPPGFDQGNIKFPFETFKKVIDEAVPLGLKAIDLSFYNEPLLRKDWPDFVNYAAEKGVLDIMFSSNGELLTEEVAERILDAPITRFMVSLDAFKKETYEKIRLGGNYDKVMKNLEYLLRRKKERGQVLPIVRVSFVKTELNEDELEDFIAHWKPKVDYMSIQELISFEGMKRKLTGQKKISNSAFKCHNPWHRLTLRASGDVLPCCTSWGLQLVMGNVQRQSLSEIWNSPEMKHMRRIQKEGRYHENPICKKCVENSVG